MSTEIISLTQKFSILAFGKQIDNCEVNHSFKEECLKLQELTTNHSQTVAKLMSNIVDHSEISSLIFNFYSHIVEEVILTKDNIDQFTSSELKLICKNLQYKFTLSQSLMKALVKFS